MAEEVHKTAPALAADGPGEPVAAERVEEEAARPDITALTAFLRGPRAIPALAVVGLFILGCIGFLYVARPFFLPVVLALMLHFLLKPLVRGLARWHLTEPIGAAVVLAVLLVGLGHVVSRLSGPATEWAARAPETLQQMARKLERLVRLPSPPAPLRPPSAPETPPPPEEKSTQVNIQTGLAESALSYTTGFLAGALETIVLLYFFLASGDLFIHKLARVLPTSRDQEEARAIIQEVQHNISRFLFTISFINLGVAVVVTGVLYVVGMPNPLLWGALAGLLNFIPYFGPFTVVLILTLVGLSTFDSVGEGIVPPLLYLGIHAVESNFLTPMILGRRLTLNPVVIFVSLIFWTWMWGIPGALLAVPLLMMFKIICDHFRPLAPIGEFLSQ